MTPISKTAVAQGSDLSPILMAIPLTKGKVTFVNMDVYRWASGLKWHAMLTHGNWYAQRSVRIGRKTTTVKLHQLIAGQDGLEVDHIDGNGLNNWRTNLRSVTHSVNMQNIHREDTPEGAWPNKTGVRNVTRARNGHYPVRLTVRGKWIQVGTFPTLEEAAAAAREARRIHFGGAS